MRKIFATILSICTLGVASLLPTTGLLSQKTLQATAQTTASTCTAATDGYTAVAHGQTVYILNKADGNFWQTYEHTDNVTHMEFDANGNLYLLDEEATADQPLYRLDTAHLASNRTATPVGVTCDTFSIEGEYLYTVDIKTTSRFLRAPLNDPTNGTLTYVLNVAPFSIASWEGKTYALDGTNHLYELSLVGNGNEITTLEQGSVSMTIAQGIVYGLTESGTLYSYDLASNTEQTIESNGGYTSLSTDGERLYLIKDKQLYTYTPTQGVQSTPKYPLINTIPSGNAKTTVAEHSTTTVTLVETAENTLLVEVDLDKSDTVFHVLKTSRATIQGIQLAEENGYTLLASHEEGYKTYLVASTTLTPLATGYTPQESTGYANGQGKIYKYPLQNDAFPAFGETERNAPLQIVGEVKGIDGNYYAVQIGELVGYIPHTQARLFDGSTPPTQTEHIGAPSSNKDAVWRLAYLLLGSVALCVLADFLILRKSPKE